MSLNKTKTVDDYIDQLASPTREIVEQLRSIIKSADGRLTEQIKWNVPVYSLNRNVCSIMAHKKHVNLQVFQGGKIKDANELEGTGKDMRHIKLHAVEDINKSNIKRYLKQAIKLD